MSDIRSAYYDNLLFQVRACICMHTYICIHTHSIRRESGRGLHFNNYDNLLFQVGACIPSNPE